ncbi:hypothetical protein ACFSTC_07165 [Nonomuraea ferruginea]
MIVDTVMTAPTRSRTAGRAPAMTILGTSTPGRVAVASLVATYSGRRSHMTYAIAIITRRPAAEATTPAHGMRAACESGGSWRRA